MTLSLRQFVLNCAFPSFQDLFAETLEDVMIMASRLKKFEILGYKINPEHIHILLVQKGTYDIDQYLHSMKRNSSIEINRLIRKESGSEYEQSIASTKNRREQMLKKYGAENIHEFPLFAWQKKSDVRKTKSDCQLSNQINYLKKQSEHHGLDSNDFLYIKKEFDVNGDQ